MADLEHCSEQWNHHRGVVTLRQKARPAPRKLGSTAIGRKPAKRRGCKSTVHRFNSSCNNQHIVPTIFIGDSRHDQEVQQRVSPASHASISAASQRAASRNSSPLQAEASVQASRQAHCLAVRQCNAVLHRVPEPRGATQTDQSLTLMDSSTCTSKATRMRPTTGCLVHLDDAIPIRHLTRYQPDVTSTS